MLVGLGRGGDPAGVGAGEAEGGAGAAHDGQVVAGAVEHPEEDHGVAGGGQPAGEGDGGR